MESYSILCPIVDEHIVEEAPPYVYQNFGSLLLL